MAGSLPLTAWLLLMATVAIPLGIESAFLLAYWRARRAGRGGTLDSVDERAAP